MEEKKHQNIVTNTTIITSIRIIIVEVIECIKSIKTKLNMTYVKKIERNVIYILVLNPYTLTYILAR